MTTVLRAVRDRTAHRWTATRPGMAASLCGDATSTVGALKASYPWVTICEPCHALAAGHPDVLDLDLPEPVDRATVRAWALAQGMRPADRGSISEQVMAAYRAAHPDTATSVPSGPAAAPLERPSPDGTRGTG